MIGILGIGTALPPHSAGIETAIEILTEVTPRARRRSIAELCRRSGVGRRHSVLLGADDDPRGLLEFFRAAPTTAKVMETWMEHAPDLAAEAARRALERAGVDASEIRHLVFVSCTGVASPGADLELISALGLPLDVSRTVISFMGCHGSFNGLRVARALAGGAAGGLALLCSVELCSLHVQRRRGEGRSVANALFADGAAALIVGPGSPRPVLTQGSLVLPEGADDMTWTVGETGFAMTLSARVPTLISDRLQAWLRPLLETVGGFASVDAWAIHPGGPRIVSACAEALGLSATATAVSEEVLKRHGNMSSATIIFLLERLQMTTGPIVALAFGPGLTAEMALLGPLDPAVR